MEQLQNESPGFKERLGFLFPVAVLKKKVCDYCYLHVFCAVFGNFSTRNGLRVRASFMQGSAMPNLTIHTPTGPMTLVETDGAITRAEWGSGGFEGTPLLREAAAQLVAYFNGKLRQFDLPLRVEASVFQQSVCDVMSAIPFGDTRTYGEIANDLGVPAQAVGQACGGNPIPVIIPCHRVLGARGLGGFSGSGGVETKVWLLRHEGAGGLLI